MSEPRRSCPGSTVLGSDKDDCDLGLTFGNPIVTKLANGTWVVVVTSGYNNVSPGDGKGYVYVLNPMTGVILKKIQAANASQPSLLPGSANTGNTTTPLGLARINDWVDDPDVDNTTLRLYGGDLQGYLWRFNLDSGTAYAIARFTDPLGVAQSVTTKPELGDVNGDAIVFTLEPGAISAPATCPRPRYRPSTASRTRPMGLHRPHPSTLAVPRLWRRRLRIVQPLWESARLTGMRSTLRRKMDGESIFRTAESG